MCGKASLNGLTHPGCLKRSGIDGIFPSLVYNNFCKKLIYQYKFRPFLSDLREVLGDLFYEGLLAHEELYRSYTKDSIFVPIPLHTSKKIQRGYNQVELLSKELSKRFGNPTLPMLKRVKNTLPQFGLDKRKRLENMKDAFIFRGMKSDFGKTIFLIDDVVTSGATFVSATETLKKVGYKKVYGLALAHGE
ncbi:MAG: ComF family protein [Candidatus Levybacteria bacterium]|nr:ComF family protein [Candidatus Levybacteria bacterium]